MSHRPDLPLTLTGAERFGLGLWHSRIATLAVEGLLFAACVWIYTRATRSIDGRGRWSFIALVVLLAVIYHLRPAASQRRRGGLDRAGDLATRCLGLLDRPSSHAQFHRLEDLKDEMLHLASMVIDIHGHYTTEPAALLAFRDKQLAGLADPMRKPATTDLHISDDELVRSVQPQMKLQKERGSDLTIFSPRAAGMAHHVGTEATGIEWSRISNDLIHRICTLLPENFAPVGQLPQHPGVPPKNCIPELERLAKLGFVGVNLNPDPAGGYWTDPPLTDRWWYPLYEKLAELDMTAMIHVTSSCNPAFHYTGAHYINGDTTAFMQLIQGNLFRDFPTLRFVIPHGGGAVPFHWGRYRGLAQEMKKPLLKDHLLGNVFFDTCVYHLPGIELMLKVIPLDNILFASEMLGAVKGIDPETGHNYDDTKRYFEQVKGLSEQDRRKIFEGNARRVYTRLDARLNKKSLHG